MGRAPKLVKLCALLRKAYLWYAKCYKLPGLRIPLGNYYLHVLAWGDSSRQAHLKHTRHLEGAATGPSRPGSWRREACWRIESRPAQRLVLPRRSFPQHAYIPTPGL
eukprot:scaffold36_cov397-Prasinococcus_capsulatus_cf.AAC.2